MVTYLDIMESVINGQLRQAITQLEQYTWYDFTNDLERDEGLSSETKLEYICKLIRVREAYGDSTCN